MFVHPAIRNGVTINHGHACECRKDIGECDVCQSNIAWFEKLPLPTLSVVLTDKQAPVGRFSLGAVAIENLIARTTHNVYEQDGKPRQAPRALADVTVNMQWFRWYQENGGVIR